MTTVADIQRALIARGYDVGRTGADNITGRATMAAIRKFQADRNLPVKYPGTVGPITLAALGLAADKPPEPGVAVDELVPPWVALARTKIGLHEKLNNKTLRDWLKSDGNTLGDPAVLPWCGDFMETVIAVTLPGEPLPANPYWALNWREFGQPIDIVALGAVAAFQREGGGHIGMIAGHESGYFHVLGGNQSNAVIITKIAKTRLSGPLRWPMTYSLPSEALPMRAIEATVSTNEA
ncbi:peptidoglycan-binding protein [Mesorhizobium yinganensis]|uniref:NlpC/P60 family protein n=1 Tax=Mesorhizobium yinganensis TaxID=3157707 RepID=UPI0032B722EF